MFPKRPLLPLICLFLVLGWVGTAPAKMYLLGGGSGAQIDIGRGSGGGVGFSLPLQPPLTLATGTVFPPLLIPAVAGAIVEATPAGKLIIPAGVFSRPATQATLGVFSQNPLYYAVATNLRFAWPSAPVTLSKNAVVLPGGVPIPALGGSIQYQNGLAARFGGAGQFTFSAGPPGGLQPNAPLTIYALAVPTAGAGSPPCTHPTFPPFTGNPACVAVIAHGLPSGVRAIGGPTGNFATTPGGTPAAFGGGTPGAVPGVVFGNFGTGLLKPAGPPGTVSSVVFTPNGNKGFTDMVSSSGFPFTTGRITIMNGGTTVAITGADNRVGGLGNIQLVAGGVTVRTASGPSTHRAWIRLELIEPVTKVFEIVGPSTGGQWSWRIAIGGPTVASAINVGPIVLAGTEDLFVAEFISSINGNPGTSGCVAQSVAANPNHFSLSCPDNFDFVVGDAAGSTASECTVVTTLGTGGVCAFNPTISLATTNVPSFGRNGLLVLAAFLLAMPVLLIARSRQKAMLSS